MNIAWAALWGAALLLAAGAAHARVAIEEPAAYSIGSDDCSMFVDGCQFAGGLSGVTDRDAKAEQSYYLTIKDGVAMGIEAFGLDMKSNTTQATWMLTRLAAAMKRYNDENTTAKRCIFVSYRAAGGEALNMFNAADRNGASDSPYCTIDGKPLIGVRQTAVCVNPLSGLTGKGPFVVLGTMAFATDSIPTQACVDSWKVANASRVIAYPDASADMNLSATAKSTAATAGAEFAYSVASSWARQCGSDACSGPASASYAFREGKGYLAAILGLQASIANPDDSVVFTDAFPGEWATDTSWESGTVCDANDAVPHNTEIGGINTGFTCPTVPDRMRGTIPMGNAALSYSNKAFKKAGFGLLGKWWLAKYTSTADPATTPFVAWAHREHPYALSGTGMAICPAAAVAADAKSLGGTDGAGANSIYVTSYSREPIRLRVSVGATVLGTYTLPARQLDLETDARQTAIPIGAARGRAKFEVLDATGNVIATKTGDVTYTDTPLQRAGTSGRNFSTYADGMPIPIGTTAAKARVVKVDADRLEGNPPGTSTSTFRILLDKPLAEAKDVNWAATSTTANAQDFYHFTDEPGGDDPQCEVSPPAPAQEMGLTVLDFCDSFRYDSVARGTTAEQRTISGNKKWTTDRPTRFGTKTYHPAGDITHNAAEGTITLKLTANQFQSAIQAHQKRDGKLNGYTILKKSKGAYIEIRLLPQTFWVPPPESDKTSQYAWWLYDTCHWDALPGTCGSNDVDWRFLEFDMLEYKSGLYNSHHWRSSAAAPTGIANAKELHTQCPKSNAATALKIGEWENRGFRLEPSAGPGGNGQAAAYVDGVRQSPPLNRDTCTRSDNPRWFEVMGKGSYALLLGGRNGPGDNTDKFTVDYVRVWTHPDDE